MNIAKQFSAVGRYTKWLCKHYPVELATCIITYVLLLIDDTYSIDHAQLMPLVFAAVYAVNNWSRNTSLPIHVYYATIILAPAICMIPHVSDFINSSRYAFALLLATLILLLSQRGSDDTSVANALLRLIKGTAMAIVVAAALSLLTALIYFSIIYIFSIETYSHKVLFWCLKLYLSVIAPATFLFGQRSRKEITVNQFTKILVNYILGSAIVIYTAILYIYLLKIVATWQLPAGGLAAMITAFYIVAFFGMILHHKMPNRYYNLYYKHFGIISVPLLLLFWTGVCYRIAQYGFTMGRAYMMFAGFTMTIGSILFIAKHRTSFKTIPYVAAALIVCSTFIPGISANDIGLQSQKARMISLANKLHLYDSATGKLIATENLNGINKTDYEQLAEAYIYVSRQLGEKTARKQFGTINRDLIENYNRYIHEVFHSPGSFNVANYPYAVPSHLFNAQLDDGILTVKLNNKEVMKRPVNIKTDINGMPYPKDSDYVYCDSEYMLVVGSIWCNNGILDFSDEMLFSKHSVASSPELATE
ncbi:MAG: DUF4153 domain-containing protein [Muribaculaceae bacterium]